jgi:hypothetical protein
MAAPSSYPWVIYDSIITIGVESTPTIVFNSNPYTCVLISVLLCNTSANDIFVNFYTNRGDVGNGFVKYNYLISQNTNQDILNTTTINGLPMSSSSESIVRIGDILYAYSDSFSNTFDCMISYAQLLESS